MINSAGERVWVKFHFKTAQGIKNFTGDEATEMKGKDPDFAQRDLVESIDRKDFPKWLLKIQVMTLQQAATFPFNPFDLTKTWSQKDFPLIDVGVLELNENPKNYFAEVEQSAFAPAHVINGIDYSPDKMLQGRILSYPDAHRHRLGPNYEQIPVNRCPYAVNNYERDGVMRVDGNGVLHQIMHRIALIILNPTNPIKMCHRLREVIMNWAGTTAMAQAKMTITVSREYFTARF